MSDERERGRAGGLIFVACMFIGGGIGLSLGRPEVGGAIGMGIGFFLMALVRHRDEPIEIRMPSSASAYFLILLGIAFIVAGLGIAFFPEFLQTYVFAIFAILFGIGFLIMAGVRLRKGSGGSGESGSGQCCT